MPIRKKTSKVDIHIWIEEAHLAILDRLCEENRMSRGAVIAALLEEYQSNQQNRDQS